MKQLSLQCLTIALLSICILGQYFPPISADGSLYIDWSYSQIDNQYLEILMKQFVVEYNIQDLKMLYFDLSGNKFQTLSALTPLSQYYQATEIHIQVKQNSNLTYASDLSNDLPPTIKEVYVDFSGSQHIQDYSQFIQQLQNKNQLFTLELSFENCNLTQWQHDSMFIAISQFVSKSLTTLALDFVGQQQILNSSFISNLKQLNSLQTLLVGYEAVCNSHKVDLAPIFKLVMSHPKITGFAFGLYNFEKDGVNVDWVPYISKLKNLNALALVVGSMTYNLDNENLNYIITNTSSLTNLQQLALYLGILDYYMTQYSSTALQTLGNLYQLQYLGLGVILNSPDFSIDFVSHYTQLVMFSMFMQSSNDQLTQLNLKSDTLQSAQVNFQMDRQANATLSVQGIQLRELSIYGDNVNFAMVTSSSLSYLNSLDMNIFGTYDCQTLSLSDMKNLNHLEIRVYNPTNYQALGNVAQLKKLQSLMIEPLHDQNFTFFENYNQLVDLTEFNYQNVSHSYINVYQQGGFYNYDVIPCHDECLRCSGVAYNQCISCSKYFLYNSQCIASCPAGYHPNIYTHTCDPNSLVQNYLTKNALLYSKR